MDCRYLEDTRGMKQEKFLYTHTAALPTQNKEKSHVIPLLETSTSP